MTSRGENLAYDHLKRAHPTADWQRIESSWTGVGIPDVNGCKDGVEVWVETKQSKVKLVSTLIKPHYRPAQIAWMTRRVNKGGRVYVAIAVRGATFLVHARNLQELKAGVTGERLSVIQTPPQYMFSRFMPLGLLSARGENAP